MPCCIATLHYLGCQHQTLCKLHCTDFRCDSQSLCPPELQRILVAAKYRWSCEKCLRHRYGVEDNKRFNQWTGEMERLAVDKGLSAETRALMAQNLGHRNDFVEDSLQEVRIRQILEIQKSEEWLWEYASTALELLYGAEDPEDMSVPDDGDSSMSGVEEEQPEVSNLDDDDSMQDDVSMQNDDDSMQEDGPEQNGQEQEQHDIEMEGQQETCPEPDRNQYMAARQARLDELFRAKDCGLVLVRDTSRTAHRHLAEQLPKRDTAPPTQPSNPAAAPKPATMPAKQSETVAQEPSVLPVYPGVLVWNTGLV